MKPKDNEGSYLERWAEDTIEDFLDLADGVKYLQNLKPEEREEHYNKFRELYDAEAIGVAAESELAALQWEAVGEPFKLSEEFHERLLKKIKEISFQTRQPEESKEQAKDEEKAENATLESTLNSLTNLDYLTNLASSYLIDASQYVLAGAEMKNTLPTEFIGALREIYTRNRDDASKLRRNKGKLGPNERLKYDEDKLAFLEVSADYLLDFVNSPDGSKYGAKGLYEFLDFVHYLRSKENDEEITAN